LTAGARSGHSLPFGAFYGNVDVRCSTAGIDISVLNADPHRVVERHSHDAAHFVLVLDGLYVSSAAGAEAISRSGTLVFNPAGTTHRDRFEARSRVIEGRFLTLSIATELMDASESEAIPLQRATALREGSTIALAERIARECHVHSPDASLMRESLSLSLLATVSRARTSSAVSPPAWLAIARELLDDRCNSDVRIGEVAQAAGVHPVHLARVFRRYLGCSPGDYLRRRRHERSCILLRKTQRSLSDIALTCGYVDQSHFATAFKCATAVTPGAYRRHIERAAEALRP
jgi:AraC family transcriptional regulator